MVLAEGGPIGMLPAVHAGLVDGREVGPVDAGGHVGGVPVGPGTQFRGSSSEPGMSASQWDKGSRAHCFRILQRG